MSEKILLIDGHSILNRAFYGLPDLTNGDGIHTGAVYGFLNILFRILEEEKPQYLAVAFDVHAPTFRHKMYEAYKGTRHPMPEELREQVPLIQDMLHAMGVSIVTLPGYEADDILGTLSRRAEKRGMDVTILSGDRDLLQLATEHVMIRLPKTQKGQTTIEDYRAADVLAKYEVTPPQIIELKALMGDSSDNIPGLPGVGEKTAVKIIAEYGTIENAHAHADELKPNKARISMQEHYDLAVLSKKLATINTESPVEFSFEDAAAGTLFTPEAYELCKKLEFRNLLNRFSEVTTEEGAGQKEWFLCTDPEGMEAVFQKASACSEAGISYIQEDGVLVCAGIAVTEDEIYVISGSTRLLDAFCRGVERLSETTQICCHDVKGLLKYASIRNPEHTFDPQIAAYLLNPLKAVYPYEDLAREYLGGVLLRSREEFFGKRTPYEVQMSEPEKLEQYVSALAWTALALKKPLTKLLMETGMEKVFREIETPLVFTLDSMEKAGIRAEGNALREYGEKLQIRIDELTESIYRQAGEEFNINSPKQLGVILFEKMAIPGGKKTKSGYSTAADILEKLAPEQPIVKDILEYRQLTKLKSTYADGLAAVIGPDGKIHSTFNQTITATGRISSTEPNLQNIPVRMELGRLIRKVFVPEEGFVFLDADYSQIELRVLAHMSGDENLIAAYRQDQDIHRITASQVFHVPFEEVTPLMRRNAKAVNFGIVYGISSFGLSQDLSISRKEAAEYIERYFETYPKIKTFLDGLVLHAKESGYAVTMFGRRRPVPELKSGNFMQRSFGERVAMNSPIQGSAADIIKIAMNRVYKRLRDENLRSRLVLQVHDELLIETWEPEKEQVSRILEEEMKGAAELSVALEIDMHEGNSWYEAK